MNAFSYRSSQPLPALLAQALDIYRISQGHLPPRITVGKQQVVAAQAALRQLAVSVPLNTSGGCLANEVWLWLSESEES